MHLPPQPDETCNDVDGNLPPVRISPDLVLVGDVAIPASWIEQHGVTVTPGNTENLNRVSITFLVGSVDVADESVPHVRFGDPELAGQIAEAVAPILAQILGVPWTNGTPQ